MPTGSASEPLATLMTKRHQRRSLKKPTKSVATTGTFSSAKMPVAATPSSAKPKAKAKAAAVKKAPPSEDSDEEQKMDIDEEKNDSDVVLVEEVK